MKKLLLITILTFASATCSKAAIWVEGAIDCGSWLSARKTASAQYLEHYLVGTVNGLAMGSALEIWGGTDGIRVNREQLYFWMDGWCQTNPLLGLIAGTFAFANERTNGAWKNRPLSK